jgi:hypothetical protein
MTRRKPKPLPRAMREPRSCRRDSSVLAWYYIEPSGVRVVTDLREAFLSTRQLESALKHIKEYRK